MQLLRPPAQVTSGEIRFRGEDLTKLSTEQVRQFRWQNVSMVFQSAMNSLNPLMRVGDQFVDMMKAHRKISKDDALARAAELMELVGMDRSHVRSYPHELSGGMRQRTVIAMALALGPELMIMDEPTTALDVVVQREILQQVQDLQRDLGFAVLFITHDLSLLVEFSDRIAIMYAGEIVESAPSDELFRRPLHPYTVGLMNSFPPLSGPLERIAGIPGLAAGPREAAFGLPLPHALHALRSRESRAVLRGRPPSGPFSARSSRDTSSPATCWTRRERRRCGTRSHARRARALEELPGSRRVAAAPADAARRRRRHLRAEAGNGDGARRRERQRQEHGRAADLPSVHADRRARSSTAARTSARCTGSGSCSSYRSRVQMIFQDPFSSLNPAKRVDYHVSRPLLIHQIVPKADVLDRVHELLDSVGLVPAEEIAKKYPHELSGGQRQRVAIARALAVEPEVILADEPTSMLDVSIRLGILNLILDLKRERNIAFLYVTHDLASARYVADDVLVMYAGQIVEHGPTDEVLQRPMHPYTKLLLSAVPNPNAGLHSHRLAPRPKTDLAVDLVGCRFAERCPLAVASCVSDPPALLERRPHHLVRCPIIDPST